MRILRYIQFALVLGPALGLALSAAAPPAGTNPDAATTPPTSEAVEHTMSIQPEQMKWDKIFPEMGEKSSEICVLHVDPRTKATQLMIRVPADVHVPRHWHSANETHTVLSGTFVIECEGKREVLKTGGFNYVPAKMPHEAWTTPGEGAVLFITVDSAWDINWVNGPPKPQDLVGGFRP